MPNSQAKEDELFRLWTDERPRLSARTSPPGPCDGNVVSASGIKCSSIFTCAEGRGRVKCAKQAIALGPNDALVVVAFWINRLFEVDEKIALFSACDRPLQEAMRKSIHPLPESAR